MPAACTAWPPGLAGGYEMTPADGLSCHPQTPCSGPVLTSRYHVDPYHVCASFKLTWHLCQSPALALWRPLLHKVPLVKEGSHDLEFRGGTSQLLPSRALYLPQRNCPSPSVMTAHQYFLPKVHKGQAELHMGTSGAHRWASLQNDPSIPTHSRCLTSLPSAQAMNSCVGKMTI